MLKFTTRRPIKARFDRSLSQKCLNNSVRKPSGLAFSIIFLVLLQRLLS